MSSSESVSSADVTIDVGGEEEEDGDGLTDSDDSGEHDRTRDGDENDIDTSTEDDDGEGSSSGEDDSGENRSTASSSTDEEEEEEEGDGDVVSGSDGQHTAPTHVHSDSSEHSEDSEAADTLPATRPSTDATSAAVHPRVPPIQLHPWQRVTSRMPVDVRPPEDKLVEARKLAKMSLDSQQHDTHAHYLVRALSLSTLLHGDGHLATVDLRRLLAEAYMDVLGYAVQAAQHAKQALKTLRNNMAVATEAPNLPGLARNDAGRTRGDVVVVPSFDETEMVDASALAGDVADDGSPSADSDYVEFRCLLCLGKAQLKQNKLRSSVQTLEEADRRHRRIIQTTSQCDIADIVSLALTRSRALRSLRQVDQAVAILHRAVSYCSQLTSGGGETQRAQLYSQLCTVLSSASRWTEAMDALYQARNLLKKLSRCSAELADCEISMAHILMQESSGCDGSPELHLRRALKILHRLHGRQHAKALEIQEDLARLMVQSNQHKEATDLLKEVIHDKVAVFGDHSVEVGKSHQLLGTLYLSFGKMKESHGHLTKARDLLSSLLGARSRQVDQLSQLIAMLNGSQKQRPGQRQRFAA